MKIQIYYLTNICDKIINQGSIKESINLEKDYNLVLEYDSEVIDLNQIFLEMNTVNLSNYRRSLSVNDIIAIYDKQWRYYIITLCGFTEVFIK